MSEVTNLLLAFSILERAEERLEEVNEWLSANEQLPLASVWTNDTCVGGGKRMDAPLYAGAFNAFPLRDFLTFLRTLRWDAPSEVQLLVRGANEGRWVVLDG